MSNQTKQRWNLRSVFGLFLAASVLTQPVSAQTIERIQESGEIRLGFRADAQPFSYRDESGNAAGYAVAVCEEVVETVQSELGLANISVENVLVTSGTRFSALQDGQIDVLCGAATVTLGRRENMSFSMPIFLSGMSAMLRADAPSDLKALVMGEDPEFRPPWRASYAEILKQRILGVIRGTTAETWLSEHISNFNMPAHVVPYDNYDAAVENMSNGRVDVLFGDRAVLLDIAERHPGSEEFIVLDRQYTYEAISLAIPRGDHEFQLLIDKALSRLYRSGDINSIYSQYFGELDDTARSLFTRAALPE